MDDLNLIKKGLLAYETDIPNIKQILHTMKQAKVAFQVFPYVNMELQITVVAKGVTRLLICPL